MKNKTVRALQGKGVYVNRHLLLSHHNIIISRYSLSLNTFYLACKAPILPGYCLPAFYQRVKKALLSDCKIIKYSSVYLIFKKENLQTMKHLTFFRTPRLACLPPYRPDCRNWKLHSFANGYLNEKYYSLNFRNNSYYFWNLSYNISAFLTRWLTVGYVPTNYLGQIGHQNWNRRTDVATTLPHRCYIADGKRLVKADISFRIILTAYNAKKPCHAIHGSCYSVSVQILKNRNGGGGTNCTVKFPKAISETWTRIKRGFSWYGFSKMCGATTSYILSFQASTNDRANGTGSVFYNYFLKFHCSKRNRFAWFKSNIYKKGVFFRWLYNKFSNKLVILRHNWQTERI